MHEPLTRARVRWPSHHPRRPEAPLGPEATSDMHDLKFLRQNRDRVEAGVAMKGAAVDLAASIDRGAAVAVCCTGPSSSRRGATPRAKRSRAKEARRTGGSEIKAMRDVGDRIKSLDASCARSRPESEARRRGSRNCRTPPCPRQRSRPEPADPHLGNTPPRFDFEPKPHWDIATDSGCSTSTAVRRSRARILLFTGRGARLERGLIHFMLDFHTRHHGTARFRRLIVRRARVRQGQLPKLEGDR